MTDRTRRTALQILAAAPLAGIPTVVLATPTGDADAVLLRLAAEMHALDAALASFLSTTTLDLDELPGYLPIESRQLVVVRDIIERPAATLAGIAAKARVLKTPSLQHDYESLGDLGISLAEDIRALADRTV